MHVMTSSIPSTMHFNTPKTIQSPSSLVDSSLVSYAMFHISNGFKSWLFFTGWLSMTLVIIGIILHMFLFFINTYGSYLKSIHHSYFYIHQFSLVAQPFPTLALYPHRDTIPLVFSTPYDNISDISHYIHPYLIFGKVLYQFGRKICDPHHHIIVIQGTDCVDFSTLWEGVCIDLFSF